MYSKFVKHLDTRLAKLEDFGATLIRVSLGITLLASAFYNSYLDPAIPIASLNLQIPLIPTLYTIGMLLVLGLFTRLSSLLGLLVMLVAFYSIGQNIMNGAYYIGVYLFLLLAGSNFVALDRMFFGAKKDIDKNLNLGIFLLRTSFGFSILYLGFESMLGPILGIIIIFGLQTRLTSIIFILIYLNNILPINEPFWTHLLLLSIPLYFVINDGGGYTLGRLLFVRYSKENKKKK